MKYAAEMASGGMTHIPSFMVIGSGIHVRNIKVVGSTILSHVGRYMWRN
jgi:hypothetical protein